MTRKTGDEWRAQHPGKGRAVSNAAWMAIWSNSRKASVRTRQVRSLSRRDVKVTLPRVTLDDDRLRHD